GHKTLNLTLEIGTKKNGLWFCEIKEKEGFYIIANITAEDVEGNSITVEPFIDFLVLKGQANITNITLKRTCNANFSLQAQEFGPSQTVNYSVRMTNLGENLFNLNYSVSSQIQVYPKPLELLSLPSSAYVDIRFDFVTPNLTEDKNYSFVLNVTSKECNFTFPFSIKVRKFEAQKQQKPQGEIQFPTLPVGSVQFPEITLGNWKISSQLFPVFLIILIGAVIFVFLMIREFFRHGFRVKGVKKSG
ncbi:MAG: hypothetical protein NZ942_01170, partial [Candidatus Aenigmarchaeota archaeon]|nr:hypothetical protein [Candidatus Aenigmarchaeota archaeon]